jgi:uncharacterized protein YbaP (TraB family)
MRWIALVLVVCAGAARAEPALWRVDSPTAQVYLFGTMHILPKPATWFSPKIAAAFHDSAVVWEEADVGLSDPAVLARIMGEAVAPEDDLMAALPAAYAEKLHTQMDGCGLGDAVVTHVKPWMATMMVSICQMMSAAGGKLGPSEDNPEAVLAGKAKEAGKGMMYFETADQQIGYLSSAPEAAQLVQLRQAIDEAAGGKDEYGPIETGWLAGDVAAIAANVEQARKEDPASYDVVFRQRNVRFAARIEEMLQGHGTVFVAIGAGHFAGPESVIALLEKQGAKIVRQ